MKNILIIALLSGVGFFAWQTLKKGRAISPREEVEFCIRQTPVSSVELARICDKYPTLAQAELKNKKITITGTLKKVLVKGVDRRDLMLEMDGSRKRNVTFTSDVVSTKMLRGVSVDSLFRFQKHGSEIYVERVEVTKKSPSNASKLLESLGLPKLPVNSEFDSKVEHNTSERVVAFREMEPVTLEGIFQYIRPGSMEFEWIQPSAF